MPSRQRQDSTTSDISRVSNSKVEYRCDFKHETDRANAAGFVSNVRPKQIPWDLNRYHGRRRSLGERVRTMTALNKKKNNEFAIAYLGKMDGGEWRRKRNWWKGWDSNPR